MNCQSSGKCNVDGTGDLPFVLILRSCLNLVTREFDRMLVPCRFFGGVVLKFTTGFRRNRIPDDGLGGELPEGQAWRFRISAWSYQAPLKLPAADPTTGREQQPCVIFSPPTSTVLFLSSSESRGPSSITGSNCMSTNISSTASIPSLRGARPPWRPRSPRRPRQS